MTIKSGIIGSVGMPLLQTYFAEKFYMRLLTFFILFSINPVTYIFHARLKHEAKSTYYRPGNRIPVSVFLLREHHYCQNKQIFFYGGRVPKPVIEDNQEVINISSSRKNKTHLPSNNINRQSRDLSVIL
jgi:hypothetical protein